MSKRGNTPGCLHCANTFANTGDHRSTEQPIWWNSGYCRSGAKCNKSICDAKATGFSIWHGEPRTSRSARDNFMGGNHLFYTGHNLGQYYYCQSDYRYGS